LADSILVEFAI